MLLDSLAETLQAYSRTAHFGTIRHAGPDVHEDATPERQFRSQNLAGRPNTLPSEPVIRTETVISSAPRGGEGFVSTTADRTSFGNLHAWFGRARLRLENIAGGIDVRNDSFETVLVAASPLGQRAHRIVSETGHLRVETRPSVLAAIPVMALSASGLVRIPTAGFDFLEATCFDTPTPEGIYGSWRGFITKPSTDQDRFAHFERVGRALGGSERPAGLDLISRSGSIRIVELPSR
jgi:hypothetical protein